MENEGKKKGINTKELEKTKENEVNDAKKDIEKNEKQDNISDKVNEENKSNQVEKSQKDFNETENEEMNTVSLGDFFNKKMIITIGGISFVIIVLLIILINVTLGYNKIYKGVSVNGIKVGGMTVAQAEQLLNEKYAKLDDVNVEVYCSGQSDVFNGMEVLASFDAENAAKYAYEKTREGNIFQRIFKGIKYQIVSNDMVYDIDYERLTFDSKVDSLISSVGRRMVEASYIIDDKELYITTGITGLEVNEEELIKNIIDKFNNLEFEARVEFKAIEEKPKPINLEKIRNEIKTEVVDAAYKNNSGAFELIKSVDGIDFNLEEAKKIVSKVSDEGVQITIDLIITKPKVTTEQVLAELFPDTISTFTTYFEPSEVERSENVKLSANFINDIIIMPGEEFSYNNVVGERSVARGFKVAKVYQSGQVLDGIGGGICQTSSTLYNAVLYADLQVTERRNHSLSVSYVKLGRDATVVYGSTDFKFKNNKATPIKVVSNINNGMLTVSILGINSAPSRSVELETETVEVKDFTETIVEDNTLPVGTQIVTTTGHKGYKVKTFKVTKKDGNSVSRDLISTDTYSPIIQVKKVGTNQIDIGVGNIEGGVPEDIKTLDDTLNII